MGRRSQRLVARLPPEPGDEKAIAGSLPRPDRQGAVHGHACERMGKRIQGELGVVIEKTGYGLGVFRSEEGAGGVDQAATGPHGSGGRLEKGLLAFQQVVPTVEAEPPTGVGLAAPDAASGAGGIEQNAIEAGVGRRGLEDISVFESDGRTVG